MRQNEVAFQGARRGQDDRAIHGGVSNLRDVGRARNERRDLQTARDRLGQIRSPRAIDKMAS